MEEKKSSWFCVLYIDTCQHAQARSRLLARVCDREDSRIPTEHVAIHGVPYELPDQNSSPSIPSGSQDSYLPRGAKKRYIKCEERMG